MTEQPADAPPSLPRASVAGLDAHRFAIAELASDLRVGEVEGQNAYESELREFADARIQMFVPLLVGKRVRKKLLSRHPTARGVTGQYTLKPGRRKKGLWSRKTLEDFERTLTLDELTREDSSRCREIITLLKAEREDREYFPRYGNEDQKLITRLIERFDGFC